MLFNWLTVELTNRCNKSCPFCGRVKARKDESMELGDMSLELLNDILIQFDGEIVQFSKDGEPLLYEHIWSVGQMCRPFVSNIVTNGKLLWEKRDALVDNFTSITVSVYEDDEEQFENIKHFIEYKRENPLVFVKFLGDYYNAEYEKLGIHILKRSLHNPNGDNNYAQSKPPVPEIGVCIDFLSKPSIDWQGNMYVCNRFDPNRMGVIGNCHEQSIRDIWESLPRRKMRHFHTKGMRAEIPFCATCEYWGIATNG